MPHMDLAHQVSFTMSEDTNSTLVIFSLNSCLCLFFLKKKVYKDVLICI